MNSSYSIGLYVPNTKTQRRKDGIDEWIENQVATK
jgi:hypothetical protein